MTSPSAPADGKLSESPGKRPALVWVILALYACGLISAAATLYFMVTRQVKLPAGDAAFLARFGFLNYLGIVLSLILSLGYMVDLFRLRRRAVAFVTAGFAVLLVKDAYYVPQFVRLGHGATFLVVGLVGNFLIVCYTWHLRRAGMLR